MSKLRLIQCGVGGHGGGWVRDTSSKSPDFDLVAIVDVVPANLESAGEAAGVPAERRFDSLEAALDAVEADAVLTVTPPAVHVQHARTAFGRGLHLMTEKPLADDIENGKEMLRLAREAGKQLVVSQNYRFNPSIQTLKALLAEQVVGEFGHGHLDFYIPADFTGSFREKMEYVLLVDMAIHHLDLIRAVTGRDIVKITAQSFRPAWSWYEHDPGLKMLMELEGGIPFSYSGDWSAKGRSSSWSGDWRLQCAEGALLFERDKVYVSRSDKWQKNQTVEEAELRPLERGGAQATLAMFAEAIRSGQPAEISGEDNIRSFGAVITGVMSAKQGRTVTLEEIIG
jgi:predicted dehydrogenase